MILVDSSKWIDHLRYNDPFLFSLLDEDRVVTHPLVQGELAMGTMKNRKGVLESLSEMPSVLIAQDEEVMDFVETHSLFGRGIGYIDAHLLVSCKLTQDVTLWTGDRRLHKIAESFDLAFKGAPRPS